MKQEITREQYHELSDAAKLKLRKWFNNPIVDKWKLSTALALSIGQMIELLNEHQEYQFHIFRRTLDWKVIVGDFQYGKVLGEELCDSLWEAVKEVLEK